ncbi:hypothetical protein BaRGS_00038011 [Batillaria attramentaria]|uniref:Uncharacterized protein n=1 Tax=Batillaria attramentaria TaxID=370345 RepID=A0ABD0J757_9CAEN
MESERKEHGMRINSHQAVPATVMISCATAAKSTEEVGTEFAFSKTTRAEEDREDVKILLTSCVTLSKKMLKSSTVVDDR